MYNIMLFVNIYKLSHANISKYLYNEQTLQMVEVIEE